MNWNNRIIHDDNGTLVDLTKNLSEYNTGTGAIPIVASEDKLYIGSEFPFNHRFLAFDTANTAVSVVSDIEYWDGDEWKSVVEIIDESETSGGATFGQDGIISWTPNKNDVWARDDTVDSGGTESITGLGDVTIYDLYWARLTFSADLDAGTILKFMGNKFSDDLDLAAEYPALDNNTVRDRFQSGKTDWEEQSLRAADYVINDLRIKQVSLSKDQILDWHLFKNASIHRTAAIIYNALGKDFQENQKLAMEKFHKAMNLKNFGLDTNRNATLEPVEKLGILEGTLHR